MPDSLSSEGNTRESSGPDLSRAGGAKVNLFGVAAILLAIGIVAVLVVVLIPFSKQYLEERKVERKAEAALSEQRKDREVQCSKDTSAYRTAHPQTSSGEQLIATHWNSMMDSCIAMFDWAAKRPPQIVLIDITSGQEILRYTSLPVLEAELEKFNAMARDSASLGRPSMSAADDIAKIKGMIADTRVKSARADELMTQ